MRSQGRAGSKSQQVRSPDSTLGSPGVNFWEPRAEICSQKSQFSTVMSRQVKEERVIITVDEAALPGGAQSRELVLSTGWGQQDRGGKREIQPLLRPVPPLPRRVTTQEQLRLV